jgi:FkbM family methyltransferase
VGGDLRTAMNRILDIYRKVKAAPDPLRFIWVRATGRFLMATRLSSLFRIQQNGFRLRFYPSNLLYVLWKDPHERDDDINFLRAYLRQGDIVVDIGANVGNTALAASVSVGSNGRVYAMEAHPKTFQYLTGNVDLNKATNLTLYNVAIGDKNGHAILSDISCADQNAILANGPGILVPIRRLDDILEPHEITLLKIDVEGFELFVLLGAQKLLESTGCVYCELAEAHFRQNHYTTQDVLAFLISHGFELYQVKNNEFRAVPADFVASTITNIVAVKSMADCVARTGFQVAQGR